MLRGAPAEPPELQRLVEPPEVGEAAELALLGRLARRGVEVGVGPVLDLALEVGAPIDDAARHVGEWVQKSVETEIICLRL